MLLQFTIELDYRIIEIKLKALHKLEKICKNNGEGVATFSGLYIQLYIIIYLLHFLQIFWLRQ